MLCARPCRRVQRRFLSNSEVPSLRAPRVQRTRRRADGFIKFTLAAAPHTRRAVSGAHPARPTSTRTEPGLWWVVVGCGGLRWGAVGCGGFQWASVGFSGFPWVSVSFSGFQWVSVGFSARVSAGFVQASSGRWPHFKEHQHHRFVGSCCLRPCNPLGLLGGAAGRWAAHRPPLPTSHLARGCAWCVVCAHRP